MSKVVDRLVRMRLNLSSPDGNLCATVDSERRATFSFRDETRFDSYDATLLAAQVEAVVRAMDIGRKAGIKQAYAADGGELTTTSGAHWDATHRRFNEAAAGIQPIGESPTGLVILAANASLSDCSANINARTLHATDAATFLRELSTAYQNLLNDRRHQRAALLKQHFGN